MKQKLTEARVYALKGWAIKTEDGKFFAAPNYDQRKWHGPHKNLQSCCTAIARKLQEGFTTRRNRVEAFHGRR